MLDYVLLLLTSFPQVWELLLDPLKYYTYESPIKKIIEEKDAYLKASSLSLFTSIETRVELARSLYVIF